MTDKPKLPRGVTEGPTPNEDKLMVAASFHVYDADKMTDEGRKRIATWLRRQANWLMKHGPDYAPRFRARYMVPKSSPEPTPAGGGRQPASPSARG